MLLKSLTSKSEKPSQSKSGSVSYDYSHADEKRQSSAKADSAEGDAAQAAYSGDIGGVINASRKIKALRDQANSIDPTPRVRSVQASERVGSASNLRSVETHDPRKKGN